MPNLHEQVSLQVRWEFREKEHGYSECALKLEERFSDMLRIFLVASNLRIHRDGIRRWRENLRETFLLALRLIEKARIRAEDGRFHWPVVGDEFDGRRMKDHMRPDDDLEGAVVQAPYLSGLVEEVEQQRRPVLMALVDANQIA